MEEKDLNLNTDRLMQVMNSFHQLNMGSILPDVTRNEFTALGCIKKMQEEDTEKIKVSKVVKFMHASAPAVSRTLRTLEEKHFILRQVDEKNRRNTFVVLTEAGEEKLKECCRIMKEFGDAVWGDMGEEDMHQLILYLEKLQKSMKKEITARKIKKEKGDNRNDENI